MNTGSSGKLFALAISIGVAVAAPGVASAADMPVKAPVYKAAPPTAYDYWSGFYLGAHAGYGVGHHKGDFRDFADDGGFDFNSHGGLLGIQGGYNWMVGRSLYGIELDASWANINGSRFATGDTEFKTRALYSGRFRSGVAIDNVLLFSSIGLAYVDAKYNVSSGTSTFAPASQSLSSFGLVSGFGAEWALSNNLSLRGEYLHYWLDKKVNTPTLTTISYTTDMVKLENIDVVRLAMNYRFGSAGHPMAAAPVFNWAGFYAGLHAGYGRSRMPGTYDERGDNGTLDIDPRGFLGGAQVGYNWQNGAWVYGLEADASWADMSKSRIDGEGDTEEFKTSFLGSARARVGATAGNKLFYLTGGIGYVRSKFNVNESGVPASVTLNTWGPVIGSGVEWAFAPHWNARLEGLTYFFSHRVDTPNLTIDSDSEDFIRQGNVSVIRLGVNYSFGGTMTGP